MMVSKGLPLDNCLPPAAGNRAPPTNVCMSVMSVLLSVCLAVLFCSVLVCSGPGPGPGPGPVLVLSVCLSLSLSICLSIYLYIV